MKKDKKKIILKAKKKQDALLEKMKRVVNEVSSGFLGHEVKLRIQSA